MCECVRARACCACCACVCVCVLACVCVYVCARARAHVCLVVTTVGFGDIIAHSTEERIAYIVLMICGAFVWGTLLAQVGEIHRAASFRDQEKLIRVSTAVDFLNENDVP